MMDEAQPSADHQPASKRPRLSADAGTDEAQASTSASGAAAAGPSSTQTEEHRQLLSYARLTKQLQTSAALSSPSGLSSRKSRSIAWSSQGLVASASPATASHLLPCINLVPFSEASSSASKASSKRKGHKLHPRLLPSNLHPTHPAAAPPRLGPATFISFSPCGSSLLAYFPPASAWSAHGAGLLCVWEQRPSAALNDWALAHSAHVVQTEAGASVYKAKQAEGVELPSVIFGPVIDVKWIAAPREYALSKHAKEGDAGSRFYRTRARGPQRTLQPGSPRGSFLVVGGTGVTTLFQRRNFSPADSRTFDIVQGSLHNPSFASLSSTDGKVEPSSFRLARLGSVAIGGAAEEPIFLIAFSRLAQTDAAALEVPRQEPSASGASLVFATPAGGTLIAEGQPQAEGTSPMANAGGLLAQAANLANAQAIVGAPGGTPIAALGATPGALIGATPGALVGATPSAMIGATPGSMLGATPGASGQPQTRATPLQQPGATPAPHLIGMTPAPGLGQGQTPAIMLGATPGLALGLGASPEALVAGIEEASPGALHGDDRSPTSVIELCEVRIAFEGRGTTMTTRPLDPVAVDTAAFGLSVSAGEVVDLRFSAAGDDIGSDAASGAPRQDLRLLAGLSAHADSTALLSWDVACSSTARALSDAFTKLECKKRSDLNLDELKADWRATPSASRLLEGRRLIGIVKDECSAQAQAAFFAFASAEDVKGEGQMEPTAHIRFAVQAIDSASLEDRQTHATPLPEDAKSLPALSPNGALAIVRRDASPRLLNLVPAEEAVDLLALSVRRGMDPADVVKACLKGADEEMLRNTLRAVASMLGLEKPTPAESLMLLELAEKVRSPSRRDAEGATLRVLDLANCLRALSRASIRGNGGGVAFRYTSVWPLVAQQTWLHALFEALVKEAILFDAAASHATPPAEPETASSAADAKEQASTDAQSLLALFTNPFALTLLQSCARGMTAFTRWLRSTEERDALKDVIEAYKKEREAQRFARSSAEGAHEEQPLALAPSEVLELARTSLSDGQRRSGVDFERACSAVVGLRLPGGGGTEGAKVEGQEGEGKAQGAEQISAAGKGEDVAWWASFASSTSRASAAKQESIAELVRALISPASDGETTESCVVDAVKLFVSADDTLDEASLLGGKGGVGAASSTRTWDALSKVEIQRASAPASATTLQHAANPQTRLLRSCLACKRVSEVPTTSAGLTAAQLHPDGSRRTEGERCLCGGRWWIVGA